VKPPRAPLAIRNTVDVESLVRADPCDAAHVLGSFWPYSRASFESHIAKGFKECIPARDFEPHISALAEFYARRVLHAIHPPDLVILSGAKNLGGEAEILRPAQNDNRRKVGVRLDWVVRVLGSAETEPDPGRPLSVLAGVLCRLTGARDASHLFFKSESRPPMRVVGRLSGPEAMKGRLRYVAQDLFIRPADLGGTALLIDDIANTGASMRIYAQALKSHAGIERVVAVNLAATRFAKGRDGRGMLTLDTTELDSHPSLRHVLVDSSGIYHLLEGCPAIKAPFSCEMRFVAERKAAPCPSCCVVAKPKRRWWPRKLLGL